MEGQFGQKWHWIVSGVAFVRTRHAIRSYLYAICSYLYAIRWYLNAIRWYSTCHSFVPQCHSLVHDMPFVRTSMPFVGTSIIHNRNAHFHISSNFISIYTEAMHGDDANFGGTFAIHVTRC